jgi:hypothetical protein
MSFHNAETGYSVHVVNAFTYANAAARTGAVGLVAADNGKIALQSDTKDYYILVDYTVPTWDKLTNQSGGSSGLVQVVTSTEDSAFSTTSTSYVATPLAVTITPTSSSNRVMINWSGMTYVANLGNTAYVTLFRNSTNLASNAGTGFFNPTSGAANTAFPTAGVFVDSPATTSATTYTVYIRSASGGTVYFGTGDDTTAVIITQEISV